MLNTWYAGVFLGISLLPPPLSLSIKIVLKDILNLRESHSRPKIVHLLLLHPFATLVLHPLDSETIRNLEKKYWIIVIFWLY